MATKKATTTKALTKWDEKFASHAKKAVDNVKNIGGGIGVKFGRGSITVGGTTIPGGKLECIVLGFCDFNAWYEKDYNPKETTTPDCYAFATAEDAEEMKPHASAADPQSEQCHGCEKNEFGTAKQGRGKACGNNIRLGLITAKDAEDAGDIAKAEIATAKVSPTNLKHWAGYVKALQEEHNRPPWAVVTQIQSFDDPETQIRLEFTLVDLINDEATLTALEKKQDNIQEAHLQVPFVAVKDVKPAVKAGGSRRFAAAAPAKGKARK